jgi:hypothetical protein
MVSPATVGSNAALPVTSDKALFCALCVELTGFAQVELYATGLCDLYFETTKANIGPETFDVLIALAADLAGREPADRRTAVQERIYRVDGTRTAAQRILMLWYTGTWFDTLPFGGAPVSAEAYVEGLVWRAIGAHPMAAKPQGYGAWSAPPPADPLGEETADAG